MHNPLSLILLFLLVPFNWSLELSYPVLTSLGGACPPRDTCSSLTGPQDDHLWGGRTCECGPHCINRSTCCIDAKDTNRRIHSERIDDSEACRGVAGGFSVLMVDRCPDRDSSYSDDKCENSSVTIQEDPLMSAPVTSKTSGRTYRNYFCALCHQDAEASVVWDISLQGLTKEQANQTTSDLLEKLVFDPAHGSWGLLVYRNRTRNPKKITENIPSQNRETVTRSNKKEISQKTIDDELETIDEKDESGKFILQESINTGNGGIIEISVTRYNRKPQRSTVVSQQTDGLVSSSTLFGFYFNSRGQYQKWVGDRNFRIKEENTQSSSRLEVDFESYALSPQRDEPFSSQMPADDSDSNNRNIFGCKKVPTSLFEKVEEHFVRVLNQRSRSQTANGDLPQRNTARYENPSPSTNNRQLALSVSKVTEFFLDSSAPAQNRKEQYKEIAVSDPQLQVSNAPSKTYESGSRESVQMNPTADYHRFYSPFREHAIDSGSTDQNTETGPKSETSEKGPHLTVESPRGEHDIDSGSTDQNNETRPKSETSDRGLHPTIKNLRGEPEASSVNLSPTFQKLNIKFSVPVALRQIVTKCFPTMIHGCPDDYADQDIKDACASYYAPVRLRVSETRSVHKFRNLHCGLCNNATADADSGFCVLEQAPRRKTKFSFAMLLDVNREDDEEERAGRCDKGQVFDPFFKKCRTLKCARPNFVVKGKKCVKA